MQLGRGLGDISIACHYLKTHKDKNNFHFPEIQWPKSILWEGAAYEIRLWESKYLLQVRECQLIPKSSALFTCSHGSAINKHSRRYDWIIYIFSRDRGDRRPQITTVTRRINRVSVPSERDVCENEYVGETRRQNNWVFFLVRQHTDTNVGFHAIDQRHTIHFMRVRWYWFIWVRVPYNAVSWYRGKKKIDLDFLQCLLTLSRVRTSDE